MSIQYAIRNIINDFKKQTGKDFYEWRSILLQKKPADRTAALKYLVEKGLSEGNAKFLVWTSSAQLDLLSEARNIG